MGCSRLFFSFLLLISVCRTRRRRSRTYKSGPPQIRVQYNAEDVMLACYWLRVAEIVATPARRLTGLDIVAARSINYLFSDVYVYCIHDMYFLSCSLFQQVMST
jgi:hypothetical protein